MSVDTLRETFHINRVTPDKIQDFLTAQTYRSEITNAKEKIKTLPWAFLQSVCKRPIRQGKSPSYAVDEGLLCIKPKNTNEMIVSLEELSYIQPLSKDEVAGQRLQKGDVVITRSGSGTIGRASIFLSDKEVYTNDHLFIVRTDTADSHYTCAFLNTYWGHRLLEAGISGSTGQLNLSNEHIKGITLYTPAELAQKYIGDKVRQAERLRAAGKLAHSKVADRFESLVGAYDKQSKPFERVSPDLLADRLDQNHYKTSLLSCLRLLQSKKHISLADRKYFTGLTDGDHGNPKYGTGPIYLRASEMSGGLISVDSVARVDSEYAKGVSISCWAKTDDVIFSVVGTLGLTAIVDTNTAGLMSRGVAKVTSDMLPNYYLKAFFKTHYFQSQLERHSVGSVQRGVYLSALEQVIIPVFDQSILDEIAENERLADDMIKAATVLMKSAKFLVEALIEGQLTEAELITAEKVLQAGSDRLDRYILNRLNTDGIDGEGPALFSDLDDLYRLLTLAEVD